MASSDEAKAMTAPFIDTDFASPSFQRDPFPVYKRLREETPVARFRPRGPAAGGTEAYVFSRYSDVSALIKDGRFAKDPVNAGLPQLRMPAFLRPLTRNMLSLDDPDHARLKTLVMAAFTPKRIETMRHATQDVSTRLLDEAAKRGSFDLIADYAMPLPVTVISELLGVPKADQARFARWSGALIRAGSTRVEALLALPEVIMFLRYCNRLIAMKRVAPEDDLVSALVAAKSSGEKLSGEELMAMIAILLSAGHETTVNFIGNGMLALLKHQDALADLRAHPEITGPAIEELLRFAGPVAMSTHRYARKNVIIAGLSIPRGLLAFGLPGCANRDAAQFSNPDQLDLARVPNRHVTFGEGGHYCVGASLARMEGAIAFRDLITRFPNMRLMRSESAITWKPGPFLRGPNKVPIAL
jgi:cytochrome P450